MSNEERVRWVEDWLASRYDLEAGTIFGVPIEELSRNGLLRLINHLGTEQQRFNLRLREVLNA